MKKSIFVFTLIGVLLAGAMTYWYKTLHQSNVTKQNPDKTLSVLDVNDVIEVTLGKKVYSVHCAVCHGTNLEGQPNWKYPGADGRLPAPPHDESGHTWHHPNSYLIHVVKESLTPGIDKPIGYQNNMPAFGKVLSDDEVIAVITYIKSTWPIDYQEWQEETNKPVKKSPQP